MGMVRFSGGNNNKPVRDNIIYYYRASLGNGHLSSVTKHKGERLDLEGKGSLYRFKFINLTININAVIKSNCQYKAHFFLDQRLLFVWSAVVVGLPCSVVSF